MKCVVKRYNELTTDELYEICANTFRIAREKNLACGLGGAISSKSTDFIKNLNKENLIDKFETRKVVFHADAIELDEEIFKMALTFELQWLKSKRLFYSGIRKEDESRILMLEQRLNG